VSRLFDPAPGTTAWLVRHEVRLAWRGTGRRRLRLLLPILALLAVAAHVGAWFLVRSWPPGPLPPVATMILGAAAWTCISLMLSQGILQSVTALFDRGDLDLLLSSPIPTRSVFTARCLGIAFNAGVLYLCLLAPIADVGPLLGHPGLLAVYPAMAGLSMAVAAAGIALTLLLVRLIGARRARTAAQVLGTLVGAAFFLGTQLPNVMGPSASRSLVALLARWTAPGGPLEPASAAWLPARALQGEPAALLAVLALGVGGLWLVVGLAHRRFLAGTQESLAGGARRARAAPRAGSVRFRAGSARNVLFKEWRLILRDPQLISQTLMQVLYLLPTFALLLRAETRSLSLAMPSLVLLASSLAGSLAWITVAAEDAPELLGSSPNSMTRLRVLKVLAALLPVWLLMAPVLAYLAIATPAQAPIFAFCLAGGTVAAGAGQIWYPRQGKRTDMKRRTQGHTVVSVLEFVVIGGWAATAWCLSAHPAWTPLALAVAGLGSTAIWWLGRAGRDDAGADTVAG
jgi:ABC-2 type transport system permease protein